MGLHYVAFEMQNEKSQVSQKITNQNSYKQNKTMALKNIVEGLAQRIEEIEIKYEELDNEKSAEDVDPYEIKEQLETEVYEIEEELGAFGIDYKNYDKIEKLTKRIEQIKREQDIPGQEGILDMMFPDGHDD